MEPIYTEQAMLQMGPPYHLALLLSLHTYSCMSRCWWILCKKIIGEVDVSIKEDLN